MSLRGFGMTWQNGAPPRGWYFGADGIKRWLDNDEPVETPPANAPEVSVNNWLAKLTGGRPMRYVAYLFTNVVSGEGVCHYRDRLGRDWMATSAWSLFRVERTNRDGLGGEG